MKVKIDWDEYKEYDKSLTRLEKKILEKHFNFYVEGNDCFNYLSKPEMEQMFDVFKSGWIFSQISIK